MSADRQRLLDWFGGMIEHVPLPATGGVSSETLRAVLLAVYRIPGEAKGKAGQPCWAGQAAIGAWASAWLASRGLAGRTVSERTARRALSVLERDLELIASYRAQRPGTEVRTRATLDHYVILWSEVGSVLDRSRGVTRQLPTRATPATRPGHVETDPEVSSWPVDRPAWPVDRPAWPVDRPAWPVDRPAWPVDRPEDTISARADYGKDQEILSCTTTIVRADPDGARAHEAARTDGTEAGWVAAEAVLRSAGVGTAAQRIDQLRARGMQAGEALETVRQLVRIARANAGRFRSGIGAALAYRLAKGDWPCAVVEDLAAVETAVATKESTANEARWRTLLDAAFRAVRARTARGQCVDDADVVEWAVRTGVPRAWAEDARGLVATEVTR